VEKGRDLRKERHLVSLVGDSRLKSGASLSGRPSPGKEKVGKSSILL